MNRHIYNTRVNAGLFYEDTFAALNALGWIKEGKFVWVVLEVLADMEFISQAETVKFSKEKHQPDMFLPSTMSKFFLPFAFNYNNKFCLFHIVGAGQFKYLKMRDQISCLSLAILHCAMKFRADGKIVHNPQVEINCKKIHCPP